MNNYIKYIYYNIIIYFIGSYLGSCYKINI